MNTSPHPSGRAPHPDRSTHGRPAALASLLTLAALLSACATSQPVVYRPAAPSAAEAQRIAKDTQECRTLAERRVGLNARKAPPEAGGGGARAAAEGPAKAGVIGFVAAAANGLVLGSRDVWNRARAGAAAGAAGIATKTVLEWNDPDKVYTEFVERCMDQRGHDVLGWR
jgi:hypothetical protein